MDIQKHILSEIDAHKASEREAGRRISDTALAEAAGTRRHTIGILRRGGTCTIRTAQRLLDHIGAGS